jgi:hypothetical protein
MTTSRTAFILFLASCCSAAFSAHWAQTPGTSSRGAQQALTLDVTNDGQQITATVGEQIDVNLASVGPKQYGNPIISSPALRFDNVAIKMPVSPGGHMQIYIFDAVAEGEALLQIPSDDAARSFTVTVYVQAFHAKPLLFAKPDQANTAPWTQAWTNLVNDVEQGFTPSLPRLTSVEVEFVLANPGPADGALTMTLLGTDGKPLAIMWKSVPADDCGNVRFALPGSGLEVSPGQKYRIRVSGDTLFGWKYTVGGYQKGQAWFNGKPLLPDARSAFRFRTFGAT